MNPRRRWLRISLWVMAGLAIGAAGAYFLIPSSPEQMLEAGEADYDRGVRALADDDNAEAARRFDEAVLQADKVLDDLNKKDKSGREQSDEELRKRSRLGGRALWLKARALRDRAFAHAAGEGKPL